jgi:hypothetical protein
MQSEGHHYAWEAEMTVNLLTTCAQTLQTAGLREMFGYATSGIKTITELRYQEYCGYTALPSHPAISACKRGS